MREIPNYAITMLKKHILPLLSFSGRINRLSYLAGLVGFMAAVVAASLLTVMITSLVPEDSGIGLVLRIISFAVLATCLATGLFAYIAMTAQRCHDAGWSARWVMLLLVPGLGWMFIIFMMLMPEESNENQYGPQDITE